MEKCFVIVWVIKMENEDWLKLFVFVSFFAIFFIFISSPIFGREELTIQGNVEKIIPIGNKEYQLQMDNGAYYKVYFDLDNVNLKNQSSLIITMRKINWFFIPRETWDIQQIITVDENQIEV